MSISSPPPLFRMQALVGSHQKSFKGVSALLSFTAVGGSTTRRGIDVEVESLAITTTTVLVGGANASSSSTMTTVTMAVEDWAAAAAADPTVVYPGTEARGGVPPRGGAGGRCRGVASLL